MFLIDEQIGTWAEVEMDRDDGGWGARPNAGTRTWIIVAHDHERFVRTLTATNESSTPTYDPLAPSTSAITRS
ncbi:MAG: hypothetical protein H7138_08935 [Myxococcales bacterium]|nr:hypothetical protein [Myxococcales bacterium]